ncbi:MAG: SpoIIE family protein phosphatase [Leptospiraceae bacterium]|nr:SpoIIE family protein phosphatase [Leptospiraceae bacterium]MCP5494458.1 SpoIIE family protein phosphatase [Leptospiraceae bacterium]
MDENQYRILIVDDTQKNIQLIGTILKEEGYTINVAQNGVQALNLISKINPDLILLDVMMPEMDGFEACQKIKENPKYKDIPIIFLTARVDTEDIVKGFEMGAADYIAKPFQAEELLARISTHLELRNSKIQLQSTLKSIQRDLDIAQNIQHNILPKNLDSLKNLKLATQYLPMSEVGGDFYDISEIRPGIVRVFLADATGHGIQAALITMAIKSEYESLKLRVKEPSELLNHLNANFMKKFESLSTFFTCFLVDIHLNKNKVFFSMAAHPRQVLIKQTGEIKFLATKGPLIGLSKSNRYNLVEFDFSKGDTLILFSDGVYEEFNREKVEFGQNGLYEVLTQNKDKNVNQLVENILESLENFLEGKPKQDDITIIGIENSIGWNDFKNHFFEI